MTTQFATRPTTPQAAVQKPAGKAMALLFEQLTARSIPALRVSLGLVFLVFGAFKFIPGFSPAEDLAVATIEKLTFGLVSGQLALVLTAVVEVFIGLTLVSGRLLRLGLAVLAGAMGGIMAPLVLFPGELYLDDGVTLTAQYVFKDIVLLAAGLVVAAHTQGARLDQGAT
jgi:putative oxidoreductase